MSRPGASEQAPPSAGRPTRTQRTARASSSAANLTCHAFSCRAGATLAGRVIPTPRIVTLAGRAVPVAARLCRLVRGDLVRSSSGQRLDLSGGRGG